ncbi:UDP-N-acetylmuramate dehydrogenase [Patescibacteria group bacterium]|nr:UDP-N-acetylmuramate dehydrogenase [Patescibacteria group bacterium]
MPRLAVGVSLARHTTLKVGGEAKYFTRVQSEEELRSAMSFAEQHSLPIFVLGGGSNVLVSDDGFAGVVIQMGIQGIMFAHTGEEVRVTVGAGVVFDEFVAHCVERGYWGLENLSHIPGTVGATPIQNVGAYGVEVGDCIFEVQTLHLKTATERTFSQAECDFDYRSSFFKTTEGSEYVITSVTFILSSSPQPRIDYGDLAMRFAHALPTDPQSVRAHIIAVRSQKFPDWQTVGTAGSFFKNPIIVRSHAESLKAMYPELPLYGVSETHVKCSLGFILDKVCGLKGYREGFVRLYEKQALVLVAETGVRAQDITMFADAISKKVFSATGIVIEREVTSV